MVCQVIDAIGATVSAVDNDNSIYACVMNQLRTHHTRLSIYDEPSTFGGHTIGSRVANHIHLGMVAANFYTRTTDDLLSVTETFSPPHK